ncbi:MAG: amino acid ABC transporter substrate-binding protein [Desertimonas sp.]
MRRTFTRTLAPAAAAALLAAGWASTAQAGADTTTPGTEATDTTAAATDTTAASETTAAADPAGGSVLDTVLANDVLRCGVRDDLPGFSTIDENGDHVGFDADFCRVIAAGVLGDATKVEFVDVATDARFPALQSGEIDVLVRNTTWTASRDGSEGATFLQPTFYDGQQMMVAADSGLTSIDDMDGAIVCVAGGTTTEGNVATEFERRGLAVDVQSFDDVDLLQEAFQAGSCDGWSSDGSQLAALRANYPDGADSLVIFEDVFSKEPLAPAVIDGDTRWAQAVEWSIFATIQAEEWGVSSTTVDADVSGDNPAVVQFLGGQNAEGTTLDPGLGLPTDYAYQIVSQVGNYGEIFEANLPGIGITDRGLNALWADGGLQYAPPYR